MGQAESTSVGTDESRSESTKVNENSNSKPQPSMESLIAEAAAYGDDENESLDAKAEKALNCPCIADLRSGPCGTEFSDAFRCFLKSTAEEKGSDCVHPFVMLQNCIKVHPNAFSKDVLAGEEVTKEEEPSKDEAKKHEEVPSKEYRIIPPKWSLESQPPKPRL